MNRIIISILAVFLLFSCKNKSSENTKEDNKHSNSSVFKIETFNKSQVDGLNYVGELIEGKTWRDKNGENILIFTSKVQKDYTNDQMPQTNVELHVYHYIASDNGFKLLREIKDFENKCDFDNRAVFSKNSISITDIDENGYAEAIFVYRLGCTSELSPDGLKLFLLENGNKYAIRGNTIVNYGYEKVGGDTKIDEEFNKAPKSFLDYAKQIWDKEQIHESIN